MLFSIISITTPPSLLVKYNCLVNNDYEQYNHNFLNIYIYFFCECIFV